MRVIFGGFVVFVSESGQVHMSFLCVGMCLSDPGGQAPCLTFWDPMRSVVRACPSRIRVKVVTGGRLAGWPAGWLAGQLVAGLLACWLACWLAGLLAGWLARKQFSFSFAFRAPRLLPSPPAPWILSREGVLRLTSGH